MLHHPTSTPFPYTTLFRSGRSASYGLVRGAAHVARDPHRRLQLVRAVGAARISAGEAPQRDLRRRGAERPELRPVRSEEHTSELQSRFDLVCRLLLEKKKT